MADQTNDPSTPSGDYQRQFAFWTLIESIKGGAAAMRSVSLSAQTYSSTSGPSQPVANLRDLQRGLGPTYPQSPYLPAFPNESYADYDRRRKWAPFSNLYEDIADNLASKPFSKECTLDDAEPQDLKDLADNLDGQGNSLHTLAKSLFRDGIDKGIAWIFVDYTKVAPGVTLADERAMNARPYWVEIEAERLLAVYSAFVGGSEQIYHARIKEDATIQDGYDEYNVERVRVLDREALQDEYGQIIGLGAPTWTLWELQQDDKDRKANWQVIGSGPITIGVIPLVPFIPVKRSGLSWCVRPALRDLAHMQIEEFQQESNLKYTKEMAAFPMLAGNGVTPPGEGGYLPTGPKTVLYAPPGGDGRFGSWGFIEPSGSSLTFLQSELDKFRDEMRTLGRQPLASANLTVITTANVSMKAHSSVQAWSYMLKDALEQAWVYTCMWLNRTDKPKVFLHLDFGVDFEAGSELEALLKAQAQAVLSKRTIQDEFKRRGVLSDEFDPDEEEQRLAEDQQGLAAEVAIDPVTGEVVQPSTRPQPKNTFLADTAPPAPPPKPTVN